MNKMGKKVGFIGAGKMASAIILGVLGGGLFSKEEVLASEHSQDAAENAQNRLGIRIFQDNKELVDNSDIVVLCVKPFVQSAVLEEIKACMTPEKLVISIAAGISTEKIADTIGGNPRVIRIMPNTPALLGEGISSISKGKYATDEDLELAVAVFSSVGDVVVIDESLVEAVTGVSGSGPAFFYYMIEELAQGGVKLGLDYDTALKLSAKTALGAAKMVYENIDTTKNLMRAVTTPGGCTEVGLEVMKARSLDKILHETAEMTAKKAKALGQ